ncbi:MAG: type I restriction endonuclease subunit R [Dehalococcoidia bacterium]
MTDQYSESTLVEQPAIELFQELGYERADCFYEQVGIGSTLGRQTTQEVVLVPRLRAALRRLNQNSPEDSIESAVEELVRDRSTLHPAVANREIYLLLKNGVRTLVTTPDGDLQTETVRVIDWNNPENNDFFLASQFWISGEMYKRRVDLLGFVNGLPLILLELKAAHKRLENAYRDNVRDYKSTIPQLFWYNTFVIVSNGSNSRIGSMSAEWEHFNEWKKISDEQEPSVVSLETIIRGTCDKQRFLDLAENFTVFTDVGGPLVKLVAKNHQYFGVNNAIKALQQLEEKQGRLGVFWHTQGSGKSYSMMFFAQKVLRRIPGGWTFLIVTDRQELDDQIYKNFANAGVITEPHIQATSGQHLRRLLKEDHRYVFTLIQKFWTERGQLYPKLSDRTDIIVITDEAHRSQYDIFAQNMRNALPGAAFLAFTGTPLMVGEERTRQVFGDYVSIYNFKQSVDDAATVPLYYENRIPELQLTNRDLKEDMERLLEEAEMDEEQEKKLEREFGRQYHLITRDDRLERIAEDIVAHFMGRGHQGKAMVVSIDKATAVRMYDKVLKYWKEYQEGLRTQLASTSGALERWELEDKISYMKETDMAVVVSQSQNEVEDMMSRGLDIVPHRRRMLTEDMDKKFKDPDDPFRIVFVCAMWMTGFDVPCCSTIYLDKPMRNHTLMQTIARANRVFRDKVNGLIVDYVGVFCDLQKALAIYGSEYGGGVREGETPVLDKSELLNALKEAVSEMETFCTDRGIELANIQAASGFEKIRLLDDAVEVIVVNDDSKRSYLSLAADVLKLFKAILPDPHANEFIPVRATVAVIAEKIRSLTPEPDISGVMGAVEELLDKSVAAEPYRIKTAGSGYQAHLVDLSKIDFDALKQRFEKARKHTEAERLRTIVDRKIKQLVRMNRTRMDFMEKFQQLVDEYNSGAINIEMFFNSLVEFARELNEEEKRVVRENLTEEELAIFDILTKPDMRLTRKEKSQVKKVARELLTKLKAEMLVLDWRKRQQSRAQVMVTIEDMLDKGLPEKFKEDIFHQKCELLYQHVYDSYFGEGRSVYVAAVSDKERRIS